jgi:3-phosphoshikimate 1-carboxyvinyltransferase
MQIWPKWESDPPEIEVGARDSDDRLIPAAEAELFVGNSGTTMRFLTPVLSVGEGWYRLDGVPRMRERPIGDLLDALRQLGVAARSVADNGCPPIIVHGGPHWLSEEVRLKAGLSSQFLSGLLMAGPWGFGDTGMIELDGPLVSEPYVQMTTKIMETWGLRVWREDAHRFWVNPIYDCVCRQPEIFSVEPDASAASYFFAAAAITGGRVTVLGFPEKSLQGDIAFVDVLADMGCRIERCSSGITVHGRQLDGIDVDMNAISDTVMTLAALACFAEGPTTIRNVAHIRHKETDRLAALATELRKVGAEVDEFADGLTITPKPLHGAAIETYNDHRMAMSMSLIGLKVPGIVIQNPGCVAKTYPRFFADLEKLR